MSKLKMIVVDENATYLREMQDAYLEDEEIVIVAATSDGVEAVKKIEAYKPDIVLLDIILPNLDGLGVMQSIDTTSFPNPVRYIVISQLSSEAIIQQAIHSGACFYIKNLQESK